VLQRCDSNVDCPIAMLGGTTFCNYCSLYQSYNNFSSYVIHIYIYIYIYTQLFMPVQLLFHALIPARSLENKVGPEPESRCSTGLKMAALFFPEISVTVTS